MCTNGDGSFNSGTSDVSSCTTRESAADAQHLNNLNIVAEKYCNPEYVYGGVCDENSIWAMNDTDFNQIVYTTLSSCYGMSSTTCGLNNNLIDNGSSYWFNYYPGGEYPYYWQSQMVDQLDYYRYYTLGVRPVIRLDSGVKVVGGSGIETDPYQISS